MDWAKYDETVDLGRLKKEIEEAKNSSPDYEEVPEGTYNVKIDQVALKASKKGKPMTSIWFRILDGKFKNNILFYNQPLDQGWAIDRDTEFLQSLDPEFKVEFTTYESYEDVIRGVAESCAGLVYEMELGSSRSGFPTLKVKKIYEG